MPLVAGFIPIALPARQRRLPLEGDAEAGRWGLPVHGFNPIKYGILTIEALVEDCGYIYLYDRDNGAIFLIERSFEMFQAQLYETSTE